MFDYIEVFYNRQHLYLTLNYNKSFGLRSKVGYSIKIYKIFISHVAEALPYTVAVARDAVLSAGHCPVEMSTFTADTREDWDFIQSQIDVCDYLIVIVGGLYGSGYIKREFDYARSQNLDTLAFVHDRPDDLSDQERESDTEQRTRLDRFVTELRKGTYGSYHNESTLTQKINRALDILIRNHPARGWVRDPVIPGGSGLDLPVSVRILYLQEIAGHLYPTVLYDQDGEEMEGYGFITFARVVLWVLHHEVLYPEDFEGIEFDFGSHLVNADDTNVYLYTRLFQMFSRDAEIPEEVTWPTCDFMNKLSCMRAVGLLSEGLSWYHDTEFAAMYLSSPVHAGDWIQQDFAEEVIQSSGRVTQSGPVPALVWRGE